MARPTAFVALLRGINVGGKNKLPMVDLRDMVEDAGGGEVATYIQSGNVLFEATKAASKAVVVELERALEDRLGHPIPVVFRSRADLEAVIDGNPYPAAAKDPPTVHVGFLAAKPKAATVGRLDPDRSPDDEFSVLGREIYLHLPGGVGKTKLTSAYLDKTLGTTVTIRNWKTTLKLAELLAERG